MTAKVDSMEVGATAGLDLFPFFLGIGDLYYALRGDDLEVSMRDLPTTHKCHADFLSSQIPEGVKAYRLPLLPVSEQ
jgi:hypothetical protein